MYYIAPPDPHWTADDQEKHLPGESVLLFFSAHKVWSGHSLQFLHANYNRSRIAQLFVDFAYQEDWAHY